MTTMNAREYQNVQQHDYVRIAAVVPPVHLSNPAENVREHTRLIDEVIAEGASYVLFPELSLTGYSNQVLFHQQSLLDAAESALGSIVEKSKRMPIMITVGVPLFRDGMLFNAAVTISGGRILAVAPKQYLAEGREFFEAHYFAPAERANFTTVELCGQADVPFGTDIIIDLPALRYFKLHTHVCEDGWVPFGPGTLAALNGATIQANLSGSNFSVGKIGYRKQLFSSRSGFDLSAFIYASAGSGESTTDLSWDGHILIAERGTLQHSSTQYERVKSYAIHDLDLLAIVQDRLQQTSFQHNASDLKKSFRRVTATLPNTKADNTALFGFRRMINPLPFVPVSEEERNERCEEIINSQVEALVTRLRRLPSNKQMITVGVSGGLDSTLALLIAVRAADRIRLSRSHVLGVSMPGLGTGSRTKTNAKALIEALGAQYEEISIVDSARRRFDAIGYDPNADKGEKEVVFENVQAWERMQTLLAITAHRGGIVVGTGDLSERAVGWCTYLADHAGHYAVNAGVPKTLIVYLVQWLADVVFTSDERVRTTLLDILATPVTPELQPIGPGGKIVQKTDEKIGPLDLRDFFLYYIGRFGFSPFRIVRMAEHAFADESFDVGRYDRGTIVRWFRLFIERFFRNQFKRSMSVDGPKIGWSDSPRGEWRMPSDADPNAWLSDLDRVPF